MRAMIEAVLALAPRPGGLTIRELTDKTRALLDPGGPPYTPRQAAYNLRKLRGKAVDPAGRDHLPVPGSGVGASKHWPRF